MNGSDVVGGRGDVFGEDGVLGVPKGGERRAGSTVW